MRSLWRGLAALAGPRSAGFPPAFFALLLTLALPAFAAPPVVSNIRVAQRAGTHLMDIYYHVADADGDNLTVYVAVSDNGGASYNVPVFTLTGAVGPGVTPGNDRHITWNAGTDWAGNFSSQCRLKIIADDGTLPPASGRMVFIPGGPFSMGDSWGEGGGAETPVHTVTVGAFLMDQFEVTGELWAGVASWAGANGYSFVSAASAKGLKHPVQTISWHDAVKWCNARSEKEGLTPCYYTAANQTTVYRSGNLDLANTAVKWAANGYRLPTEAEWEKAARGGLQGKRFPWGDTVTHSQANYISQANYAYDISPTRGYHPKYAVGSSPYTSPVGSFAGNGYGLFDMAGNVWEWTWDAYGDSWYRQSGATANDTRGPAFVSARVLRGGYWASDADDLRCANRDYYVTPTSATNDLGFRCVRGL